MQERGKGIRLEHLSTGCFFFFAVTCVQDDSRSLSYYQQQQQQYREVIMTKYAAFTPSPFSRLTHTFDSLTPSEDTTSLDLTYLMTNSHVHGKSTSHELATPYFEDQLGLNSRKNTEETVQTVPEILFSLTITNRFP